MSRNGSGVYSLPAGNPVVTGTTISSSWANTTLSDIATALTGSVAADGQTAMTGNLQMGNNKITGLAVATSSGDALSFGQAATISALTVTGAFAANGGATLGDASGDALTINSSAVSIPNGLNFDSNTFVIDAANNNVGIGTASPAAKLDVITGTNSGLRVSDGTYTGTFVPSSLGGMAITTGGAYPLIYYINGAERMRIDSSGNVGIGTSSPATIVHAQKSSGNTYYRAQNNLANVDFGVDGAGTGILWNNSNYPLAFGTNNTERMRIDSSGNLLVGTTTANGRISSVSKSGFNPAGTAETWSTASAISVSGSFGGGVSWIDGSGGYCAWVDDGGTDFNIAGGSTSGVVSNGVYLNGYSATSWSGRSDERLKDKLEPITNAINKVNSLRAVTGVYKNYPDDRQAFLLAQDVQAVLPEAVSVADKKSPEQYLGLSYTQVIPLLVAAIKELKVEVDSLKAQLENK